MLSIDFPLSMENQWKNELLPSPFLPPPPLSPPPPFPTVYCRGRSRTEIFVKSGAPRNLRGLWGRSWRLEAQNEEYGADHGDYGAVHCRRIGDHPGNLRFFSVKSTIDRFYWEETAVQDSRSLFFPGGPTPGRQPLAISHIGTLARLIIKYPASQLLGKKKNWRKKLTML